MRTVVLGAAAMVLVATALPATAGPADDLDDAKAQLQQTLDRLQAARESYEDTTRRIAELRGEIGATEGRLREARQAEQKARQRRRRARELAERAERKRAERSELLSLRVAETYRQGGSQVGDVWLSALVSAESHHEMALAGKAMERLMDRDRRLLEAAIELRRRTRQARRQARRAAERTEQQRAEIEHLVAHRRDLLGQLEAERAEQQAVIDDLASDREAQQELIAELRRQLTSIEAVLRPRSRPPFDQAAPGWASGLPADGPRWSGEVDAAAARAGITGEFFAALVWTESYFQPDAESSAGAIGLAQLMPETARMLGVDPHDPIENLTGGARYIRRMLDRFRDLELGLAAYNAGPGRVSESGEMPDITETRLYVLTILDRWKQLLD